MQYDIKSLARVDGDNADGIDQSRDRILSIIDKEVRGTRDAAELQSCKRDTILLILVIVVVVIVGAIVIVVVVVIAVVVCCYLLLSIWLGSCR